MRWKMAYQSNKPLAYDYLSQSQSDLQNNFASLNNAFKIDHVEFNLGNEGKHNFIHIPINTFSGSFPLALNGNEIALYSESGDLYFRPSSATAAGTHTNDLKLNVAKVTGSSTIANMVGGLQVIWANRVLVSSGTATITFPGSGFTTNCLTVVATTEDAVANDSNNFINTDSTSYTKTDFKIRSFTRSGSSSSCYINYIAIGY